MFCHTEINPCVEGNGGCHVNADCVHVGPNKVRCGFPLNKNNFLQVMSCLMDVKTFLVSTDVLCLH